MEKIYDESQQQKRQQQQKKKFKIDSVTMLSFAVAIFAVVSLIAAGVSGFSFAFPDSVVTLPDSFEGKQDSNTVLQDPLSGQAAFYHYYTPSSGSNIPLICLQRDIDFRSGDFSETGNSTVSSDAGLLYLLSNLAPNVEFTYPGTGFNKIDGKKEYMDFWISQMAVWYYLNGKANNTNESGDFGNVIDAPWVYIGDESDVDDILAGCTSTSCRCLDDQKCYGFTEGNSKIFDEVKVGGTSIRQLITNARGKTGMAYDIHLSAGDGTISYDQNKEYYFSPLYTVVASIDNSLGELTSYALTVTAVDKDGKTVDVNAVITDKDGNVKNDVSALTPSQLSTFYVRVPVNKIDKNVTVHVGIDATFRMFDGKRYKLASNSNSQEVTTVQFTNKSDRDGTQFDLAPAPDTGISAGQTIYFVGLIVLLCGVGIIYANAKPKAQAQE